MCIKHGNDWYLHQKEHDYWLWTLNSCQIFILNLLFCRFPKYISPPCFPNYRPISCWLMTKRERDEKCKFGLLKGRSSKFSSTLAFPASFYKGLEEFEADLDPKQIEKLLVFFEVISTQEKISKVSFLETFGKWRRKNTCGENLHSGHRFIYNEEKVEYSNWPVEVWDLWK